jgi:hypothetical protein
MRAFAKNPRDTAAADVLARTPAHVGRISTTCVATMLRGGHWEERVAAVGDGEHQLPDLPGRPDRASAEDLAGRRRQGRGSDHHRSSDRQRRLAAAART